MGKHMHWTVLEKFDPLGLLGMKIPSHCCKGKRETVLTFSTGGAGTFFSKCDCSRMIHRRRGDDHPHFRGPSAETQFRAMMGRMSKKQKADLERTKKFLGFNGPSCGCDRRDHRPGGIDTETKFYNHRTFTIEDVAFVDPKLRRKLYDDGSVRMNPREMERLHDLVERCIVFVDRNGRVLEHSSNPFSSYVSMRYEGRGLRIEFRVQSSGYSNGSCWVKVRQGKKTLLEADGNYTSRPFNVNAKTFAPGTWEKKIPKIARKPD